MKERFLKSFSDLILTIYFGFFPERKLQNVNERILHIDVEIFWIKLIALTTLNDKLTGLHLQVAPIELFGYRG